MQISELHFTEFDQLFAPAKLNLRLKVEGRREDGYHLLSMINVALSFGDRIFLRLRKEEGVALQVSGKIDQKLRRQISDPERNLASLAFIHFCRHFSLQLGLEINIEKEIPAGGGLGGGSSDAGAVLRWLSKVCQADLRSRLGLSREELAKQLREIAVGLGADVPFFLEPDPAWVRGIGEEITRLPADLFAGIAVAVVLVPQQVSTPLIFAVYRKKYREPQVAPDLAPAGLLGDQQVSFGGLAATKAKEHFQAVLPKLICNDLEDVVLEIYPQLSTLLAFLRQIEGVTASLTGSGSTLFIWPKDLNFWDKHSIDQLRRQLVDFNVDLKLATIVGGVF